MSVQFLAAISAAERRVAAERLRQKEFFRSKIQEGAEKAGWEVIRTFGPSDGGLEAHVRRADGVMLGIDGTDGAEKFSRDPWGYETPWVCDPRL